MDKNGMGSLTDGQLMDLAYRMKTPLARICFKSELKDKPLEYDKGYVVNLENEFDKEGERNEGSHWVAFYVKRLNNGNVQPIYMDSYGQTPPIDIKEYIGEQRVPYTEKDIQSIMNEACGWYCVSFLYYITAYYGKTDDLYVDTSHFLDYFDDLSKTNDHHHNVFVLKQFFRSSDPEIRKKNPVEVF